MVKIIRTDDTPYPDRKRAACRNSDLDFHADDAATQWLAKRVCSRCSEIEKCLAYALVNEPYGVWGGLTEAERRKLKRRIARVMCPGCSSVDILEADGGEVCLACGLSWNV